MRPFGVYATLAARRLIKMKLGVLGTGYVGLVAGAGFADFGNEVSCVDIDAGRVAALNRGEVPIFEPGLPELVRENVTAGRLFFTTDVAAAVRDADAILICVGTPTGPSSGSAHGQEGDADISQVLEAARAIGAHLDEPRNGGFAVVVIKSTVPVGTAERVASVIADTLGQRSGAAKKPFAVVNNPEFLKEGSAVEDFLRPMRVIVGLGPMHGRETSEMQAYVRGVMRRLYNPVVRTNDRLLFCDSRSAELCKYASNAYLAMRVSFINDIANLCERVGADVEEVRRGMGMDTRIGPSFLFPGIGYGGSCFPKDTKALLACARKNGIELPLVEATERINARQRFLLFDKLLHHFKIGASEALNPTPLQDKVVAVWGLSFKPETDDVREAPAMHLIERLCQKGARVRASDPAANRSAERLLAQLGLEKKVTFCSDAYEAAEGADALFVCTEWRQFRQPNFQRLKKLLRGTGLFDGRNIWDRDQLRALGFDYYGIGR